jgi:hypothetical protein
VLVIRRIYVYGLTLVGLWLLAQGAAGLLKAALDAVLSDGSSVRLAESVRRDVASAAASAVVGLPVWLFHQWLGERWAKADEAERVTVLRRLAFYLVLTVAAMAVTISLTVSLEAILDQYARWRADITESLPWAIVGLVVWAYYWRLTSAERTTFGEEGGSATLRRWYVYISAFVGLALLLVGCTGVLTEVIRSLGLSAFGSFGVEHIAQATVGLGLWLLHWQVLPRRMGQQIAEEDRASTLRAVYLFLGLALGVAVTLSSLAQMLYYLLARLLGVEAPEGASGNIVALAAAPASRAIVFGVGWLYQRQAIRAEPEGTSDSRRLGVRRLYTYIVALLGLTALTIGAGGLLWSLVDLLTEGGAGAPEWWRDQIARFAMLTLVGLPVWVTHWRAQVDADEARSLSRRIYAYLALIGSGLTLVGCAVAIVFLPLNWLLGATPTGASIADLVHAVAVALVSGTVLAYHVRVVRRDSQHQPAALELTAERVVRLRAASPEALDDAVRRLRGRVVVEEVADPS